MSEPITLYTTKETAALLKVSERTVRRWIAEGTLAARRYGRQLRIPEEALRSLAATPAVDAADAHVSALALSSFAEDWDNELDAAYDDWRALYAVSEG